MSQLKIAGEVDSSIPPTLEKRDGSPVSEAEVESNQMNDQYLKGWRLWLTMIGLNLALFLVQLEMTIVTTALVAITDDVKDFRHSTWVVNAYFLIWSGFLVLWSQFSHTAGRKMSLLTAVGLFVAFSAACASAQTPIELYTFRGFQGLGGAGVFSLAMVITSEANPPGRMPKLTSLYALVALVALATGPLMGGAISANTTWRWVFMINVPAGAIVFAIILFAIPRHFPHNCRPESQRPRFSLSSLRQMDVVGGLLFLGLSILSVAALQEADISHGWKSVTTVCLLVFSVVSMIAFVIWERFLTKSEAHVMPLMTYQFVERRIGTTLASSFFIGMPFIFTMVQLPQTYQIIYGYSPLKAAVHLLPFSVLITIGGALASVFNRKASLSPTYGQLTGAALQMAAVICFATTLPTPSPQQDHPPARQYGFQILLGLGAGLAYNSNFLGIYHTIGERRNLIAPAIGASMQLRYFGSAIGLASATAAFNSYIRNHLSRVLSPGEITILLESSRVVVTLSEQDRIAVLRIVHMAFALQWKIMCGFVGCQIVAILFTY